MATFIEYGGNFVPKHPLRSQHFTAFLFGIRGDKAKMQALCDLTLNARDDEGNPPGAVRYEVISDLLLLAFLDLQLVSLDGADANKGALPEKECTFAIPLLAWKQGELLPRLVFHIPYIWLNSGIPVIIGREIYGIPKSFGQIEMPIALGAPAKWNLHADVLDRFDSSEVCSPKLIVDVNRNGGGNVEASTQITAPEDLVSGVLTKLGLRDVFGKLGLFGALGGLPSLANTRMVFLKQFRDHEVATRACYQAVLEAPVAFSAFQGAQTLNGDFDVQFFNYASAPLVSELGLANPQRAVFAVRGNVTFDLGLGETQWVAN